jgi:hypothetical protein
VVFFLRRLPAGALFIPGTSIKVARCYAKMPTKFQQLRKEQLRGSRDRPRKRGRRLSEAALRKESDKLFYGKLGPASPAKRIDPKTGEVVEIISVPQLPVQGYSKEVQAAYSPTSRVRGLAKVNVLTPTGRD